ncbi:MAG TPA: hypothetical protein VME66_01140 [Candidatus Acidoferrales bacterium]|nr:hypothetical protein [Candidatus Acidoferrales bacterium]
MEDKRISAVFPDTQTAKRAVDRLEHLGYPPTEISVVPQSGTGTEDAEDPGNHRVVAGVGAGAALGGAVGAVIAGMAAPVISVPIAILAGAGTGGLTGGMVGALVGAGVPDGRAKRKTGDPEQNGILVGVRARPGEEESVRAVLDRK